uniref:EOG090X04K8 n=1 Tax=Evadne anonyx TaxID=141404 RepID=A0A9N6ZEY1_9CRUS|nr:EOG090X04K8 [Evadne anonyx]
MPKVKFDSDDKGKGGSLSVWDWNGEGKNIALLFFLYLLQGIPLGLAASIPLLLQNRQVSYKEQAEFSFVYWPFSLKLLWAPVVDSLYSSGMGRRKTWLVPVQYTLGLSMLFLSTRAGTYLDDNGSPNIKMLTLVFFVLNFLAATQDIAVDGWALTMLHRLMFGLVYAGLVYITPSFQGEDGQFPFYYYLLVLVIYAFHQITVYSMFVAIMAFFAKVSCGESLRILKNLWESLRILKNP